MTDFFQFLAHVKACAIPGSGGCDGRYGACEGIETHFVCCHLGCG